MFTLYIAGGILLLLVIIITVLVKMYTVVDPNDAHILVIMGGGRKLYAPRFAGEINSKIKTSYFYIPFLMTRIILPLTNVKMGIPNIHLNDSDVAPFVCDVIAWIHINDPIMAAERLSGNDGDVFESLQQDLINVVQATARAAAMSMEVLEIMKNRKPFAEKVSMEVNDVMKKFGVDLVNLEVNDIKDDQEKESQVISDYERMRKAQVRSMARIEIAKKNKEAVVVEQENRKESEVATAVAEEAFTKKQIEKDKNIGIAQQNQVKEVAEQEELANEQRVEAARTLTVGGAKVEKDATIEKATGESEAIRILGEKEADVITLKGQADGKAIEAKGTAEALAKDKMAEAMQKFNESATGIEKIRAMIEVKKAMWEAYGKVAENANIKVVTSGKGGNLFGFPMNAEAGADMGQFMDGLGDDNPLKTITDKLGITKPKQKEPTQSQTQSQVQG